MDEKFSYCQLVGSPCVHEPVKPKPNSCFLIQPFDRNKANREKAVKRALEYLYGRGNFNLLKSDSNVTPQSSFCDICTKIKSAQYCIADISGEIYKIFIDSAAKDKIFLRSNIPLELGLAFGLNKPSIIIQRKLKNRRLDVSDLRYVRYTNIDSWASAPNSILGRLVPILAICYGVQPMDPDIRPYFQKIINKLKSDISLKQRFLTLKTKEFKVNQILSTRVGLAGIIKNANNLKENFCFKLHATINDNEEFIGFAEIYDVQNINNIAYVKFYPEKGSEAYWTNVFKDCENNGRFIPEGHRLELIVPTYLSDETIDQMKEVLYKLNEIEGEYYGPNYWQDH